jgi:glycine dehydrogenase subunit 1
MFIPHTDIEHQGMLKTIGVKSIEELFTDVPKKYRFPKIDLPPALTEMEAMRQIQEFADANDSTKDLICFLGAGAYNHYIPAAIDNLLQRGEFFTAYTPYQPEISQGTLQAIFEYQSLMAKLTGMEVSNASHYDGATAAAEAGILAYYNFNGNRKKFLFSPSLNPHYLETIKTYLCGFRDAKVIGTENEFALLSNPNDFINSIDQDTALVMVQNPDFFGRIYDLSRLAQAVHETGALLAVAVNPISLGLLKSPGEMGADIVVGEGQPLGIPLSFGGPYLGFFTTQKKFVRKMSGRLVGETVDKKGQKGYVLTLTAREQHIRREKATSNICTNQGLMALAATIYLSLLGKNGLRQVANLNYQKAQYAAQQIAKVKSFAVLPVESFFNEFVVKCPTSVEEINANLLDHGILGGFDLGCNYPELKNHMLLAVTEMNLKEDIDLLCSILGGMKHD